MKKMTIALMTSLVFGIAGAQADLLVNGDFETGDTAGWADTLSGGTAVASTAYAQSGSNSLLIDSTGAGDWASPNLAQVVSASPGQEFNLSGYMLNPSIQPITGASFGLFKIEFLDAGSVILEPASVSIGGSAAAPFFGAESTPFLDAASPVDTWVFSQTQAVAPANTASARFLALNVNQPGNLGPMYFDNITATLIPEPSTTALLGLGLALFGLRRRRR